MKQITIRRKPGGKNHHGLLNYGNRTIFCCLGRSGITTMKREGDGATPNGKFRLLYGFFRKDRIRLPKSSLDFEQIRSSDGWCDSPANPNYNQHVTLPFINSHEVMTRKDRLYDICIVLDYNISPRVRNLGSAIFFHLTSNTQSPTEGCIAIEPNEMLRLLPELTPETEMLVHS